MTLPNVLFGIIFATLAGALLHFWKGGNLGKLIFYILASWAGFWTGHFVDEFFLAWHFGAVGPLNFGSAVVGDLLALALAYWIGLVRTEQRP